MHCRAMNPAGFHPLDQSLRLFFSESGSSGALHLINGHLDVADFTVLLLALQSFILLTVLLMTADISSWS